MVRRPGAARRGRQRHDRRVVLADARTSAGWSPRPRSTRSPGASRSSSAAPSYTADQVVELRAPRDRRRRGRASPRRRRRTRSRSTTRSSPSTRTSRPAIDAPLMIYNWPHGTSVEIGTALADRLVEIDTRRRAQGLDAERGPVLRDLARGQRRVRVFGPYMSTDGYDAAARARRRRLRSAAARSTARPTRPSGTRYWRGDHEAALRPRASHARSCSRSSGCRAAGPASTATTRAS